MKKIINLFIPIIWFTMISTFSFAINDTIIPFQNNFGIAIQYTFFGGEISVNNNSSLQNIGQGFQISGFYEIQHLKRLRTSVGGRVDYNSYELNVVGSQRRITRDSVFLDNFLLDRQEITVAIPLTLYLDYFLYPKAYFLIGVRPEYKLFNQEKYDYLKTRIRNDDFDFIGEIIDQNYQQSENFLNSRFNIGLEFGFGLEIKNTAFELILGTKSKSGGIHALGLRLRQKITRRKTGLTKLPTLK